MFEAPIKGQINQSFLVYNFITWLLKEFRKNLSTSVETLPQIALLVQPTRQTSSIGRQLSWDQRTLLTIKVCSSSTSTSLPTTPSSLPRSPSRPKFTTVTLIATVPSVLISSRTSGLQHSPSLRCYCPLALC